MKFSFEFLRRFVLKVFSFLLLSPLADACCCHHHRTSTPENYFHIKWNLISRRFSLILNKFFFSFFSREELVKIHFISLTPYQPSPPTHLTSAYPQIINSKTNILGKAASKASKQPPQKDCLGGVG